MKGYELRGKRILNARQRSQRRQVRLQTRSLIRRIAHPLIVEHHDIGFIATPVGRSLEAIRCSMMNNALQSMASVMAICTAIRMAPTLLRRMAEIWDEIPYCLLLRFELPRRLYLRGAPGGIKPGQRGRHHGENRSRC